MAYVHRKLLIEIRGFEAFFGGSVVALLLVHELWLGTALGGIRADDFGGHNGQAQAGASTYLRTILSWWARQGVTGEVKRR